MRSESTQFPPEQPVSNKVSIPVCPTKISAEHRTSGRCLPESLSTPAVPPWVGPLANKNPDCSTKMCQPADWHIPRDLRHILGVLPTRRCTHMLIGFYLS